MAQTHDHEIVSIYPFSEEEVNQLMRNATEAVLMWSTKDGWPVGVNHSFVWHDAQIWMTFSSHRHRAHAIKRDNRVSVTVSSMTYPPGAGENLPQGGITFKGHGTFHDDEKTKEWFYQALSDKVTLGNAAAAEAFYNLLDSPLRTILSVTPVKKIMYNGGLADRHIQGKVSEDELGERLSSDKHLMNKKRKEMGLDSR